MARRNKVSILARKLAKKKQRSFLERYRPKNKSLIGNKFFESEYETDTRKMFEKIDKIVQKEYGKMCPEFELDCVQCRFHLIYNDFKNKIWREFIRNGLKN